jgi:hypothetical protein
MEKLRASSSYPLILSELGEGVIASTSQSHRLYSFCVALRLEKQSLIIQWVLWERWRSYICEPTSPLSLVNMGAGATPYHKMLQWRQKGTLNLPTRFVWFVFSWGARAFQPVSDFSWKEFVHELLLNHCVCRGMEGPLLRKLMLFYF